MREKERGAGMASGDGERGWRAGMASRMASGMASGMGPQAISIWWLRRPHLSPLPRPRASASTPAASHATMLAA